eukprot:363986-Chlamydomonas_euryale.AAC.19
MLPGATRLPAGPLPGRQGRRRTDGGVADGGSARRCVPRRRRSHHDVYRAVRHQAGVGLKVWMRVGFCWFLNRVWGGGATMTMKPSGCASSSILPAMYELDVWMRVGCACVSAQAVHYQPCVN